MTVPKYWINLTEEERRELAALVEDQQRELTREDLCAIDNLPSGDKAAVLGMLVNGTGHIVTRNQLCFGI